jgi:hypothetical protein
MLRVSLSVGKCTPAFDGATGTFATTIRTAFVYGASSLPVDLVGTAKGAKGEARDDAMVRNRQA